ncbi:MAG: ferredoxin [Methanobacteriales archaeon HGW-Methanobacteriales-1]|nr:MAG: ferredoxin [Methanobacteriales archaeon HGW-Methanobacteriales-1]
MIQIIVDSNKCEGSKCGTCACICPTNVFTVQNGSITIKSPDYCKLCYKCMEICPNAAIAVNKIINHDNHFDIF